jgi:beta-lactamase regulating signal transducer with metallopeptidase domain
MNNIGLSLIWTGAQVTLLSAAAVVLYRLAARRGPGHGATTAAASLGAVVMLALLALVPIPAWWDLEPAKLPAASLDDGPANAPTESVQSPAPPAESDWAVSEPELPGFSLLSLRALRQRLGAATIPTGDQPGHWLKIVAAILLCGAGLSILRLLVGLWAVHHLVRRSRPIEDTLVLAQLQRLATAMRCRPIDVRESPDLTSPATVGFFRPIVLLSADRRAWSADELSAVLAHELAHVRRRDYLIGIMARLGVALHFYHPLIHWLAGRLRLEQELAADALGARYAGGSASYLRALSRMALRQDGRPTYGLAASYLSTPGTLMRRIRMLRDKDGSTARQVSPLSHICLIALLTALVLGLSALRCPALKGEQDKAGVENKPEDTAPAVERIFAGGFRSTRGFAFQGAGQERRTEKEREPFDLPYLSPEAKGIWAFRTVSLFDRPEFKKHIAFFDAFLVMGLQASEVKVKPDLSIAGIDTIAGQVFLRTSSSQKEHPSEMLNSLNMVRTMKPFDWKKQIDKILPGAVEVPCEGKAYYKASVSKQLGILLFGAPVTKGHDFFYCLPDTRTILSDTDDNLRRILKGDKSQPVKPIWAEDWKYVERGLLAAALDCRDKKWLEDRRKVTEEKGLEIVLLENATSLVFGVDYADGFVIQAIIRSDTEQGAEKVAESIRALIAQEAGEMEKPQGKSASKKEKTMEDRFLEEIRSHSHVERQGKTTAWRAEVKISLAELLAAIPEEIRVQVEAVGK